MGTNWFVDLFLFCYEMDFMVSLSNNKQANTIASFKTKSRYLDDILNINNTYFDNMVCQIYHAELQLNKANTADTKASFLSPLRGRRDSFVVVPASVHPFYPSGNTFCLSGTICQYLLVSQCILGINDKL